MKKTLHKKVLITAVIIATGIVAAGATPANGIPPNVNRVPDITSTFLLLGLGIGALFTIHRRIRPAN
ncbi:MAG: VPDSG-CTERM sorting domain-containing protein [bacterium]